MDPLDVLHTETLWMENFPLGFWRGGLLSRFQLLTPKLLRQWSNWVVFGWMEWFHIARRYPCAFHWMFKVHKMTCASLGIHTQGRVGSGEPRICLFHSDPGTKWTGSLPPYLIDIFIRWTCLIFFINTRSAVLRSERVYSPIMLTWPPFVWKVNVGLTVHRKKSSLVVPSVGTFVLLACASLMRNSM